MVITLSYFLKSFYKFQINLRLRITTIINFKAALLIKTNIYNFKKKIPSKTVDSYQTLYCKFRHYHKLSSFLLLLLQFSITINPSI